MGDLQRTRRWMTRISSTLFVLILVSSAAPVLLAQAQTGRIEGRLVRADGSGVRGATVVLIETGAAEITGINGEFSFSGLPAGTYSIDAGLGDGLVTVSDLQVTAGETTAFAEVVDWEEELGFSDAVTVSGRTQRVERVVEAPAATTVVPETQIVRSAQHGQVPKLLQFTPGAQVMQGGVWDFNISTRGFNENFSRRVAVLVDGRDQALPFLGFPVWSVNSFPFDDLAGVDFVRGPGAALYGTNSPGGVLNMTSKEPRFNQGGSVRLAFGQLGTLNLDTRWAGELGNDWYARVVGGVRHNELFAVSRVGQPEYSEACAPGTFVDCLVPEVLAIDDDFRMFYGGVRLDKYLQNGLMLTVDAGHSNEVGGVYQAAGQRIQTVASGKVPYATFKLSGDRFNVSTSYAGLISPGGYQTLSTGGVFPLNNSHRIQVEGQTNWNFRDGSVQVVAGGVTAQERFKSFDEVAGRPYALRRFTSESQTPNDAGIRVNRHGLFGQGAWDISDRVRVVLAGRGDWSSYHDFQVSPNLLLTYSLAENQNVRFGFSRAFQAPNALDRFIDIPFSPPADLSGFEAFCTPFGVECGFGQTPVSILGNEFLDVETMRTWEVGYRGVLAERAFVTVDYYRTRTSNKQTGYLPQFGTGLGRLNASYGPWVGPAGLSEEITAQIRGLVPLLTNDFNGSNIILVGSQGLFGDANSQGVDLNLDLQLPGGWQPRFTYSWFDFENLDPRPAAEVFFLPNAPTHTYSLGLTYEGSHVGGSIDMRWVDDFRWSSSFFVGAVPSYRTVDVAASYQLSEEVGVGLTIANLFDSKHWQSFGGSILRRRALMSLHYGW